MIKNCSRASRTLALGWLAVGGLLSGCGRDNTTPATLSPVVSPNQETVGNQEETSTALGKAVAKKRAEREELDKTLWSKEVAAGRHGQFFVDLWDRLREAEDRFAVAQEVQLPRLTVPVAGEPVTLSLGVEHFVCHEPGEALATDWRALLSRWQEAGYRLEQCEWHHRQFDIGEDGSAESLVEMVLHVENPSLEERLIVAGDLRVRWQATVEDQPVTVDAIEISELNIWWRKGQPPFRLAATLPLDARSVENVADFLGLYDMDGDGDAEIIFGDRLFRNEGGGKFNAEPLAQFRTEPLNAALLADFTGDGRVDLFCADPARPPQLFVAGPSGRFDTPPKSIDIPPLSLTQAVTAGDVNGDGHLDVWLTQYKGAYDSGQMPTPYYDANDGHPSYMLLGDGTGQFKDVTEAAGLAKKRFRRTYSTSLVDLDDDNDLDLLAVSDFAGVDIYTNDGVGNFQDVSEEWIDTPNNFGMSHTLDDFDNDGRLDFYVTGMASTTARRLEHMGIGHPKFDQHNRMRLAMGYGNRMYLAAEGSFREPSYREQVARTGWSWGTTSLDYDNDGDRDLFVGNGHVSGKSARDYCSVFWRHDIYTGSSRSDPVLDKLFLDVQLDFERRGGGSWNGFEHNCLLVKEGDRYVNLSYLMGVASEFDTRAVVSCDIDSDGLMDLLVVASPRGYPSVLHVIRNNLSSPNHWIGVRLVDEPGHSPLGAKITLATESGRRIACILAGDSFTSQHAAAAHFGLGNLDAVRHIEIRWQDGAVRRLENPSIDRYHLVRASEGRDGS